MTEANDKNEEKPDNPQEAAQFWERYAATRKPPRTEKCSVDQDKQIEAAEEDLENCDGSMILSHHVSNLIEIIDDLDWRLTEAKEEIDELRGNV